MNKYLDASALLGKTFTKISQDGAEILRFTDSDGKEYMMSYAQDCCESVRVHDITGDLQSLIGSPLTIAREEADSLWPDDVAKSEYEESFTWTRYFFETATAKVCIRWLGQSNGYYGESVQIFEIL